METWNLKELTKNIYQIDKTNDRILISVIKNNTFASLNNKNRTLITSLAFNVRFGYFFIACVFIVKGVIMSISED